MGDDPRSLSEAVVEAARLVAAYRRAGEHTRPPDGRRTVYILEGCECGDWPPDRRYHVHPLMPRALRTWTHAPGKRVCPSLAPAY